MIEVFSEADGQQVLDIAGELPTLDELDFVAEQGMSIHVGWLPPGTADLHFLTPIAGRIHDLRVYGAGLRNVDAIASMTGLQHLLVDDQLDLPAIDLRHHAALQSYQGRLALAPEVLQLPALQEARIDLPPRQPLHVDNPALRSLHVSHTSRARSFAGITGRANLVELGLSEIRDLSLADLPQLEGLEHLVLNRIGTLHALDALHRFTRLRTLALIDVRHLDLDALGRLPVQVEILRTLPRTERAALKALPNVTYLE